MLHRSMMFSHSDAVLRCKCYPAVSRSYSILWLFVTQVQYIFTPSFLLLFLGTNGDVSYSPSNPKVLGRIPVTDLFSEDGFHTVLPFSLPMLCSMSVGSASVISIPLLPTLRLKHPSNVQIPSPQDSSRRTVGGIRLIFLY